MKEAIKNDNSWSFNQCSSPGFISNSVSSLNAALKPESFQRVRDFCQLSPPFSVRSRRLTYCWETSQHPSWAFNSRISAVTICLTNVTILRITFAQENNVSGKKSVCLVTSKKIHSYQSYSFALF